MFVLVHFKRGVKMAKKEHVFEDRNCVICNKVFTVNIALKRENEKKTCGNKSCSSKLSAINQKKVEVSCKVCGNAFEIAKSKVQKSGNYCSNKCRSIKYLLKCSICNKDFRSGHNDTMYCSDDCRKIGNNQTLVTTTCYCCGTTFERPSYTLPSNKRHFCSKRCAQRQFARENPARYGKNWSRIRERILRRDNYTCKKCGKQSFEPYSMNVHHIIPIESFDSPDEANVENNLEILCYECHMRHHGKDIW